MDNNLTTEKAISVPLAYSIDFCSTLICQVSLLLMKVAHNDAEKTKHSAFFSVKWFTGLVLLLTGCTFHVMMLPFCSLVLLSTNCAFAIVISAFLSVYFLGERIVWRYDVGAFLLIAAGTCIICLLSQELKTELTTQVIVDQLTSTSLLCFLALYIAIFIGNYLITRWSMGQVKLFEC